LWSSFDSTWNKSGIIRKKLDKNYFKLSFPKLEAMQKLFTYGTLQNDDIQKSLFGRILQGTPETLQLVY
jgi:hypothetical protein